MPLGPKIGLPQGSHVLHRLIQEKHETIFLSEAVSPKALIFAMQCKSQMLHTFLLARKASRGGGYSAIDARACAIMLYGPVHTTL